MGAVGFSKVCISLSLWSELRYLTRTYSEILINCVYTRQVCVSPNLILFSSFSVWRSVPPGQTLAPGFSHVLERPHCPAHTSDPKQRRHQETTTAYWFLSECPQTSTRSGGSSRPLLHPASKAVNPIPRDVTSAQTPGPSHGPRVSWALVAASPPAGTLPTWLLSPSKDVGTCRTLAQSPLFLSLVPGAVSSGASPSPKETLPSLLTTHMDMLYRAVMPSSALRPKHQKQCCSCTDVHTQCQSPVLAGRSAKGTLVSGWSTG